MKGAPGVWEGKLSRFVDDLEVVGGLDGVPGVGGGDGGVGGGGLVAVVVVVFRAVWIACCCWINCVISVLLLTF